MNQTTNPPGRRRLPRLLTLTTAVAALAAILARLFQSPIHDWWRIDPAISLLGTTALFALMVTICWLWFVFRSGANARWRWLVGVAGLLWPILLFGLYAPVLDGGINLIGLEPRWWQPHKELPTTAANDVAQSSPTELAPVSGVANFPEFLGPGRRGIVSGVKLNPDWNSQPPTLVWKQDIGEGWSGFAAVDGWAYTLEQRGALECVTCYQIADGKLRWIHENPQRYEDTPGVGRVGPRSTPTVDNGRVYAQGAAGSLMCLDASTGKPLWTVDLCELLEIPRKASTNSRGIEYTEEDSTLAWGRAGSPLIVDDLVIVPGGGSTDGPKTTLLAFRKETGELVWRGGQDMIAYGSPALAMMAGIPQITITAERASLGFDPKDGKQLWRIERPGNSNMDANCSQVTWVSDNHLLLTKGYHLGGQLVAIEPTESGWDVKTIWENRRMLTTKFSNPVIYDGHAYAIADGFLECVNLSEHKLQWKQRGKFGHGQLLLVGEHLLVHSESGTLNLVAANPDGYQLLGQFPTIRGLCWNTLCFYEPYVLVRSQQEAACIRLPTLPTTNLGLRQ